jgi:hypothetical protein
VRKRLSMISFKKLGYWGRFGNQLFQYAFLRTTAYRLGVKFYCPHWIGDEIFLLHDSAERVEKPTEIYQSYMEPPLHVGFNQNAMEIGDGTDIIGYFQTQKYWNGELVRKWYSFRETKTCRVREKYREIDFDESTGMSLRFGDFTSTSFLRTNFYVTPPEYYARALSSVRKSKNIIVFSDEIEVAKRHLQSLRGNFIFIENNEPYEDLYLMTQCKDFIIATSTFSWWGAYLNKHSDSRIVAPYEGQFRPGARLRNNDFFCDDWIQIKALRPYVDSYFATVLKECFNNPSEIPHLIAGLPIVHPFFEYVRKLLD